MDSIFLSLPGAVDLETALEKRRARWRLFRSVSLDDLVLLLHGSHCGGILHRLSNRLEVTRQRTLAFVEAWPCCRRRCSDTGAAVFDSVLSGNTRRCG